MRAAVGTSCLRVAGGVRRRLQDWGRTVCAWVGGERRTALASHTRIVALVAESWRRPWTCLGHLISQMRWNSHTAHVGVVRTLPVHSRRTYRHATSWGHGHRTLIRRRCWHGRCSFGELVRVRTRRSSTTHVLSRCQSCRCSCCRLFNGARVVVLMPGKSRSTREGLLAIGIRTFVWAFSRVYPSVTSKGTGVAKWLQR